MVGVADRERVRQRVVERQVVAREVAHRRGEVVDTVGGQVRADEVVHRAAVPRVVLCRPLVTDVVRGGAVLGGRVLDEMERLEEHVGIDADAGSVAVLLPDRRVLAPDGVAHDVGVGEPPHPRHPAEVVVEGPVLLHEDDDVADVSQAGQRAGRHREGALDARPGLAAQTRTGHAGHTGRADGGQSTLEQVSPADAPRPVVGALPVAHEVCALRSPRPLPCRSFVCPAGTAVKRRMPLQQVMRRKNSVGVHTVATCSSGSSPFAPTGVPARRAPGAQIPRRGVMMSSMIP